MPYTVTKSDGVATINIADGGFNTTTSIPLLGQNVTNYGQNVATAFVHILENFNHSAAPANPMQGQLWFNNSSGPAGELTVRVAGSWQRIAMFNASGHLIPNTHNTFDLGSNAVRWRVIYGETVEATYADIAERYEADADYTAGTVVKIGGEKEITATTEAYDADVFGVTSARPGFGLNAQQGPTESHPYIAIAGRVPVRVVGTVKKGQRLVTSLIPGVAMAADADGLSPFMVVGRALEDKTTEEEGTVLSVVGSK
jgi:hypothetical protein